MPEIQLRGKKVFYKTGPGGINPQRKSVLFIHGAGGSHVQWYSQLEYLDSLVNTLAIDLPGHGGSEGPGFNSVTRYADWVVEAIEKLNLFKISLVGHSLGGAIVQEIALMSPLFLSSIILISTGAKLRVHPKIFEGISTSFGETTTWIAKNLYNKSTANDIVQKGLCQLQTNDPKTLLGDFLACDQFDRLDDVERITIPTLIIVGENDQMTPVRYSNFLHERIRGSVSKIAPHAGHMVMQEQTEFVNKRILEFLS